MRKFRRYLLSVVATFALLGAWAGPAYAMGFCTKGGWLAAVKSALGGGSSAPAETASGVTPKGIFDRAQSDLEAAQSQYERHKADGTGHRPTKIHDPRYPGSTNVYLTVTDVDLDAIQKAQEGMAQARAVYLQSFFGVTAESPHGSYRLGFATRCTLSTADGTISGRLSAYRLDRFEGPTVDILTETNGQPELKAVPLSKIRIDATVANSEGRDPARMERDLAALEARKQADKAAAADRSRARDAELAAREKENPLRNPIIQRSLRPGEGEVVELVLPEKDPEGYLAGIQKMFTDAAAEYRKLTEGKFPKPPDLFGPDVLVVSPDRASIEIQFAKVDRLVRAYLDDAVRILEKKDADPKSNLTNALLTLTNGLRTITEFADQRHASPLPKELLDSAPYLRPGVQVKTVKDTVTHPGALLKTFDPVELTIGGQRGTLQPIYHMNHAGTYAYGVEYIFRYKDAEGNDAIRFYSDGSKVSDPRPGRENSCVLCHNGPNGTLDPKKFPKNAFTDPSKVTRDFVTDPPQIQPWVRGTW